LADQQNQAPWASPERQTALAAWLDDKLESAAPVALVPLAGGSSGSVFRLDRGDTSFVLRTTAWPPRPDSRKALEREARLLAALAGSSVPHPRHIAWCDDEEVIGAPFLVIGFVDGWLGAGEQPPAFAADRALHHRAAFAMVDAIAELPQFDFAAAGLADFGRPDGFLERQVDRWSGLMERHRQHPQYGDRQIAHWDEVTGWLREKRPTMQSAALIHGDVSFSNVMLARTPPPRVLAIIDWELATLGDPLLDLGRLLYPFPAPDGTPGASLAIDLRGYPSRESLARHYAERTGLAIDAIDYYMVLAMYKLAALIEFNHVKSMSQPAGSLAHRIADFIPDLVAGAATIARQSKL